MWPETEIARVIGVEVGSFGPAGLASCCSLKMDERKEFLPGLVLLFPLGRLFYITNLQWAGGAEVFHPEPLEP